MAAARRVRQHSGGSASRRPRLLSRPAPGGALKDIGAWLRWSYDAAAANSKKLKAVFEELAKKRIESADAVEGFRCVYPAPPPPERTGPAEVIA